jgi:membrane dipeptidase
MLNRSMTRREALRTLGAGALAAAATSACAGTQAGSGPMARKKSAIVMDGHVHVTNKIYWLGADPWQPQPSGTGWDYARAAPAGVNVIVENVGTYGYWSYNTTPKQIIRLIETFHRFAEAHQDKMGVALTADDARRIAASGKMAVFLSCESGWDQEGDLDVLRALYRLGLRSVQFSSQSGFNAYSDVQAGFPGAGAKWGGINDRGRALIQEMNRLGILIDITHASPAAMAQIIEASQAPVVCSHLYAAAVSGPGGLPDELIVALATKGGLLGIHGGAGAVGVRYRQWLARNPEKAARLGRPVSGMVGYRPSFPRTPDDANYGEFAARLDQDARDLSRAVFGTPFVDDPEAAALVPTPDEWAQQIHHVIKLAGPDHVGFGLDMVGGRSGVPADASGYPALVQAIGRVTTPENVSKVNGENWLRVIEQAQRGSQRAARDVLDPRLVIEEREHIAALPIHTAPSRAIGAASACC